MAKLIILAVMALWSLFPAATPLWPAEGGDYDPQAVEMLEKIKRGHISSRYPFLWGGQNYGQWPGLTWSDERPRRLKSISFPYDGYDERQGPIFKVGVDEYLSDKDTQSFEEMEKLENKRWRYNRKRPKPAAIYLEIKDLAGLESVALKVGAPNPILRLFNLPDLKVLDLRGGLKLDISYLAGLPNLRELHLGPKTNRNDQRDDYHKEELQPLASLKSLQILNLAETDFRNSGDSEIFKELKALKALDLSGNSLKTLEGLGLENSPISRLNLSGNWLNDSLALGEVFKTLPNLRELDLSDNHLVSLEGLEILTDLRRLDLRKNERLESATALGGLRKLESLHLGQHFSFSDYPPRPIKGLSGLTELKQLSLHMRYPAEDLGHLLKLEELKIVMPNSCFYRSKNISCQAESFKGIMSLQNIKDLSLTHLRRIENQFWPLLERLEKFECQNCLLTGDEGHDWGFLAHLRNVKRLRVTQAQDGRVSQCFARPIELLARPDFSGLDALTHLDLMCNGLAGVRGLGKLTELIQLNLTGNRLEGLEDLSGLTALTELDLSDNRLTDLSRLAGLPAGLRKLNLRGNKISDFAWPPGLYNLEELNLSQNPLTAFSVPGGFGGGLKSLNLAATGFKDMASLRGLKDLEFLDLSECGLAGAIDVGHWPRLKMLNLRGNSITSVTGWEKLPTNAIIDVSLNRLPLSALYELQLDARASGRQWRMDWLYPFPEVTGYPRSSQWDVFEPLEIKVGETCDLRRETILGGFKTRFAVMEIHLPEESLSSDQKRRLEYYIENRPFSLEPLYEKQEAGKAAAKRFARLEQHIYSILSQESFKIAALKKIVEQIKRTALYIDKIKTRTVYVEEQGRLIFIKPGVFSVLMRNPGIGYGLSKYYDGYDFYNLFPMLVAATNSITVK